MRIALQLGFVFAFATGAGFGQRPAVMPLGNPLPHLSPIPQLGGSPRPPFAPQRGPQHRLASPGYSPVVYYPMTAYDAPAEPAPGVTIIQQFTAPPAAPVAQEQPVTPQIHEYPAPAAPPPAAEPATFAILLKDGSSYSATAVMIQGKELQIVDPDGQHRRIPLDAIDRDATRRRNADRNLRLQLPY